jgi:hypothetical protein
VLSHQTEHSAENEGADERGRPFSLRRCFWVAQERSNAPLVKPSFLSPRYPRCGGRGIADVHLPVFPFSWFHGCTRSGFPDFFMTDI